MRVHSAMTTQVVSARASERAAGVAELLAQLDLTGMPVLDADGRVLGVITQLDLMRALRAGKDLQRLSVREVMSARPIFVEPETPIEHAAELMENWQVHRLPVCEDGRLVGILSRSDVLRALMQASG